MAISGISEYGGLYGSYRVVDIPKVDIETVKKQDEQKANEALQVQPEVMAPKAETAVSQPEEDKRSRVADLENISLTFNANDDFSYIGSESEIGNLDMQKAISDMRKDKVLEDYQYFVGSSENITSPVDNADGKVLLKF